ncbi:hypothetical protein EB796_023771 [Bugula neritina]|uniref:Uncharacterized protein n=1 Tax=Bugula neritina TaxID=10212 RepID=A0A7J7IWH0_BUGNE|nr:hypothetical protein EB796_023771 [Bugula neritina]
MLYFMNPKGQTTWAPPPYIDKECKKREYLEYGKLNVRIFDLYRDHLKYAENSELTNYRKYQTYTSKSSYSGRS